MWLVLWGDLYISSVSWGACLMELIIRLAWQYHSNSHNHSNSIIVTVTIHLCCSWREGSGGGGLVVQSCLTLVTPWTVASKALLSVGFPRQEYWEWVAISFSSRTSWSRNWTSTACIAGGFFTELLGKPRNWAFEQRNDMLIMVFKKN